MLRIASPHIKCERISLRKSSLVQSAACCMTVGVLAAGSGSGVTGMLCNLTLPMAGWSALHLVSAGPHELSCSSVLEALNITFTTLRPVRSLSSGRSGWTTVQ